MTAAKVALVTGANSFTGRYLVPLLQQRGYQVHDGSAVQGSEPLDLCRPAALREQVLAAAPDVVIHLAAISHVAHGDIDQIYQVNLLGTRHLLAALAELPKRPQAVLLASSANIYGNTEAEHIAEEQPAAPANDYAVSKLAMEQMARLWLPKLPITLTRPFNYTGRGQSSNFLLAKICEHFRRKAEFIELGNLDVARDFSDVRDVVQAYADLLDCATAGQTVNICSGQIYSLRQVLAMCQEITGHQMEVRVNPAFVRASDVYKLGGSRARLNGLTGAKRLYSLRQTLEWMLQDEAR